MSAPQPRPLYVVRPPNPYRIEGGDPPALDGDTWPFAKLPNAVYAMLVTSWRLAPIVRSARPMRDGATERETDWRLFVAGRITDVIGGDEASAARSALIRYGHENPGDALLCLSYRLAVGERTATRRIPRGGRLAQIWEIIGHRNRPWSPAIADELIGWRFHVQTTTQKEGRPRRDGRKPPPLPEALQRTWGEDILAALPPEPRA